MGYCTRGTTARFIVCFAALLSCALIPQAAVAQAPPPGIFAGIQSAVVPRPSAALEPATVRSRVVQVDTQKITAARRGREVLKLNLFDDAVVEVAIDRVRPTRSGYFISGRPKGMEWGEVRLVVNGPVMVGTVMTPEGKFTIRSTGSGRHIIREIDPSKDYFECDVEHSPLPSPSRLPAISAIDPAPAGAFSRRTPQEIDMPTEDGSEIRVLVVYTPALQARQGGAAGMRAVIDLLIQSANQAFEEGGITPRLVLAHATMVDFDAEGAPSPDKAIRRLRSPDDGYADEVHALRNKYAADLVHLLTDWGGQGYAAAPRSQSISNENYAAFAASGVPAGSSSEYIFTHETGHILGLLHDRYVHGTGAYPYAYGYVNKRAFESGAPTSAAWHTMMAYNTRCFDAGITCRLAFRFSNPDQTYRGDPLGVPADSPVRGPDGPADARLAINNIARWVGSYRSEACTDFSVSPQLAVAAAGGGEVIFQVDTAPGCLWEASDQAEFFNITSDLLSAGPGIVRINVEANPTGTERNASLTIAGKTLSVRQLATDEGICGRTFAVAEGLAKAAGYSGIAQCDQVTDEDLAEVESLDLGNQGIGSLKKGDFEGLSRLKSLTLASNSLTQLRDGIFRGLSGLEVLDLSKNRLAQLPVGLFVDLSALLEVHLQSNRLTALPATMFAGLANLQTLDLRYNELTALPATVFADLASLEHLDLGYNQLAALPQSLFTGLSSLEYLSLRENRLTELHEGLLAGLSSLRWLDLTANRLVDVSDSFPADLTSLVSLSLGLNRIPQISAGAFAGLSNLLYLSLQGNELRELPTKLFSGLPNLEGLALNQNRLDEVPPGLFQGVVGLRSLDLGTNRLYKVQAEAFSSLTELRSLYLGHNKLSAFPEGFFSVMPNLQFLVIKNNELRSIQDGLFPGLTKLRHLDLRFNPGYPLPLHVNLEKVGEERFKAVTPAGAPFALSVPVSVSSAGAIDGGITTVTIPAGAKESEPVSISRVAQAREAVSVDVGTLPELPTEHRGYELKRDGPLPLRILPSLLSTDAMLVDLAVNEGALDPAFDADATHYAVIVAHGVATITVTPTTNNTDATVDFPGTGGRALADADSATEGHQVNLSVGENTIQVRVTSEDETATQNYTLIVTRDRAANVCARTPQVRDKIVAAAPIGSCTEVTEAHLSEITELGFPGSGLESLKSGDFAGLTGLKLLQLGSNQLSILPADIFADLEALETMFLHENLLNTLDSNVFSGLSALRALGLSRNQLSDLPATIFSDLVALEELWLYSNPLTSLPEGVFSGLSGLQVLFLSSNSIHSLSADLFSGLPALKELYLGGNRIDSLPADIFLGLPALERLDLSVNRLSRLPANVFSGLHALESLDLVFNRIENLSAGAFSDLSALRKLRLGANSLRSLPPGLFFGLSALEVLEFDNNRLTSLPNGILVGLTKLTKLRTEGNSPDPFLLAVSLEKVADSQFRAVMPTGAPFTLSLPFNISDAGTTDGDLRLVTIPVGSGNSQPVEITRVEGTIDAVTVDIGEPPALPDGHAGYTFKRDKSLPKEILPGPKAPPPAIVTGVEVTPGIEALDVSWAAVAEAGGYKVQWKSGDEDYGEERQVVLTGAETISYTITGLAAGTEYTLRVLSTKEHADDGPPSDEVTAVPLASPPAEVTGVEVTPGVEQLEVTWTAVSGAGGYKNQWKSGSEDYSDSRQAVIASGDTTTYTIAELTADTEYTIRVIATKDNADDGEPSEEVTGTPTSADPDANGDGVLDGNDALIMYHSYASAAQLGDGETGGTESSRQSLLAGYSGKANPTDEDLRAMLRRANKLREDFG